MNDEALIEELERLRELAGRFYSYNDARQAVANVSPDLPKQNRQEITGAIAVALAKHPVFGPGRNLFFGIKQLNLHPMYVKNGLLEMMLNYNASTAVAWLHRLFKIDYTSLRTVAVMHGLNVQRPIKLSNQIHLFPLAAAPDSPNIRALSRNSFELIDIAWIMPPTIAVYDLGTVQGSIDPDYRLGLETSANFALLDAARAFTLTNDGAAVVGISWTDFVDPELMRAEVTRIWMRSQFDGALKDGLPLNVDEEALAWAERYLDKDELFRRSLDVAIDRLNLARRRRSPGDRAIDCGICLEALLGDDDPKELTHKLRVRAALLLGSTLEERRDIRREVGKLYDLRSKVVHGIARKPEQILTDEQCASRGLEICKQAVRAIVIRNARPDFKTWELTGGRDSDIG